MLYKLFAEKLLGLQGVNITNIETDEKTSSYTLKWDAKNIFARNVKQQQTLSTAIVLKRLKIFRHSGSS